MLISLSALLKSIIPLFHLSLTIPPMVVSLSSLLQSIIPLFLLSLTIHPILVAYSFVVISGELFIHFHNCIYMRTTVKFASSLPNTALIIRVLITISTILLTFSSRSTRGKLALVDTALTNSSHSCYDSEVGIELTISEMKGACSDDSAIWSLRCRIKQSYTRNLKSLAWVFASLQRPCHKLSQFFKSRTHFYL